MKKGESYNNEVDRRQANIIAYMSVVRGNFVVSYAEMLMYEISLRNDLCRHKTKQIVKNALSHLSRYSQYIENNLTEGVGERLLDICSAFCTDINSYIYYYVQSLKRHLDRNGAKESDLVARLEVARRMMEMAAIMLDYDISEIANLQTMSERERVIRIHKLAHIGEFGIDYYSQEQPPSGTPYFRTTLGFLTRLVTSASKAISVYNDSKIFDDEIIDEEVKKANDICIKKIALAMQQYGPVNIMSEEGNTMQTLEEAREEMALREKIADAAIEKEEHKNKLKQAKKACKESQQHC